MSNEISILTKLLISASPLLENISKLLLKDQELRETRNMIEFYS